MHVAKPKVAMESYLCQRQRKEVDTCPDLQTEHT